MSWENFVYLLLSNKYQKLSCLNNYLFVNDSVIWVGLNGGNLSLFVETSTEDRTSKMTFSLQI